MARLFFLLGLMLVAVQVHAEKRVALVIGNSNYSALSKLSGPENDAADVEKALRGLGYQIVPPPKGRSLNVNLTRDEMLSQLAALNNAARDARLVLLYYSGHGVEIDGENRLLPVNLPDKTSTRLRNDGIKLTELMDDLRSNMKSDSSAVVVLDACRDNGVSKGSKGLVSVPERSGFFIAFATASGSTAEDLGPNRRNSPYTEAFLSELEKSGHAPISSFFINIRKRLLLAGLNQIPNNVLGLNDASISLLRKQVDDTPSKETSTAPNPTVSSGDFLIDRRGVKWTRRDNGYELNQTEALAYCEQLGKGWTLPTQADFNAIFDRQFPITVASDGTSPPLLAYTYLPLSLETNGFWVSDKENAWFPMSGKSSEYDLALEVLQYGRSQRALCVKHNAISWEARDPDPKSLISLVKVDAERIQDFVRLGFRLRMPTKYRDGEQIFKVSKFVNLWATEWDGSKWEKYLDERQEGEWEPGQEFVATFDVPIDKVRRKDISLTNLRLCIGDATGCFPSPNLKPTAEQLALLLGKSF